MKLKELPADNSRKKSTYNSQQLVSVYTAERQQREGYAIDSTEAAAVVSFKSTCGIKAKCVSYWTGVTLLVYRVLYN